MTVNDSNLCVNVVVGNDIPRGAKYPRGFVMPVYLPIYLIPSPPERPGTPLHIPVIPRRPTGAGQGGHTVKENKERGSGTKEKYPHPFEYTT